MHDCTSQGHVMVDDDPLLECLVCGCLLGNTDTITVHVVRAAHLTHMGEMVDTRDIATPGHW